MIDRARRWLAPPVFPDDEVKTRRATLLNYILLTFLVLVAFILIGALLGGRTPSAVLITTALVWIVCLVLRTWLQHGWLALASAGLMACGLGAIAIDVALLGTVRAPVTSVLVLLVIAAGLLFDLGGIILMTVICSLTVAGLIGAENAEWLPRPDLSMTVTQWATYTAVFAWAGSLMYAALHSMKRALSRAENELIERQRAEAALREAHTELERRVEERTAQLTTTSERLQQELAERKRVEETLRQSEVRWRTVINTSPDGIAITSLDGQLQFVSDKLALMHGYDQPGDMVGHHMFEFLDAAYYEEATTRINKLVSGVYTGVAEYRLIKKDDSRFYLDVNGEILHDDTGQPVSLFFVERDVTARKEAEIALRRQNQYLAALQETTLELSAQLDLDQLIENIVTRAAALVDAAGGFFDLVDPATNQLQPRVGAGILAESLQHVAKPGEGVAGHVWQTGQPLVINDYDHWAGRIDSFSHGTLGALVGVPLINNGETLGVLGLAYESSSTQTFGSEAVDILTQFARLAAIAIENARLFQTAQQDLAERRQAEEALRQSEVLYHSLVETLPLNIFRKDAAGRFIFVNSLYCQTQGWMREEILGKTDFDLHPRELAEKYAADDERLVASGEVLDEIEEHQPIGGPRTYVHVVKSPVFDRDGRMIGLQGAFWDVTERQQARRSAGTSRS